ncbi:MAG: hypothetical protein ACI9FG_000874, partial [Crocinitomicaceae bacterium]
EKEKNKDSRNTLASSEHLRPYDRFSGFQLVGLMTNDL